MVYSGQMVTYTYQITNTGDTTLTNVTVMDDNGTPGINNDDLTICTNLIIEAGATTSCVRNAVLFVTTTIVATVTGQDPLGNGIVDNNSTTVIVKPLEEPPTTVYLPVVIKNSDHTP